MLIIPMVASKISLGCIVPLVVKGLSVFKRRSKVMLYFGDIGPLPFVPTFLLFFLVITGPKAGLSTIIIFIFSITITGFIRCRPIS